MKYFSLKYNWDTVALSTPALDTLNTLNTQSVAAESQSLATGVPRRHLPPPRPALHQSEDSDVTASCDWSTGRSVLSQCLGIIKTNSQISLNTGHSRAELSWDEEREREEECSKRQYRNHNNTGQYQTINTKKCSISIKMIFFKMLHLESKIKFPWKSFSDWIGWVMK